MRRTGRAAVLFRAVNAAYASRWLGFVAFVMLSVVAGSAFLFIKQTSATIPPLTLVGLRLGIGFMALFVLTAAFYRDYVPCMFTLTTAVQLCLLSIMNNVIPYSLYPIAQRYVDTGAAAILSATAPLFAVIIGRVLIRSERITILRILAVITGLGGIVVLSLQKLGSKDSNRHHLLTLPYALILLILALYESGWAYGAYFLVVLAAASKGCASVFAHRYLVEFKIIPVACGQTFFGSLIAIALSLIFDFNVPPFSYPAHYSFFYDMNAKILVGILYLGLASSCLAYLLQFYLLQSIGSVRQTFTDFLVPVVAMVEGAVFLNSWDDVSWWYIVSEIGGATLVLCSLGLAHWPTFRRQASADLEGANSDPQEQPSAKGKMHGSASPEWKLNRNEQLLLA